MANVDTKNEKQQILNRYRQLLHNIDDRVKESDRKLIRRAFDMAADAHKDMRRKSGEPFIFHPLSVADIVAKEIGLGATSIICALLHDVVEDTEISLTDIKREFGSKIAQIIDGLTKISKIYQQTESMQAENFRKILLTLAEDVRVILIKIADRLHNMRTLRAMPEHKQLKVASETRYLYGPLAHRLGLHTIKTELEDLAMKYIEPEHYKEIEEKLRKTEKDRNTYIEQFIEPIRNKLERRGFHFDIFGRPKSVYSIWKKMKKKNISFEEVYDIFAIRIIADSPPETEKADCWRIYSIVTDFYQPNPDRLRDWISMPKSNGYEALHTTVMGPGGKWVEVQIRSTRMHEIAEKGIAAHWKYKEGIEDSTLDEWLKQIREILDDPEPDSIEFLDNVKLNLFSEEIYVFTPKGDVMILPTNATVLDFAFKIHTEIGYKCIGAKVNQKLVSLNHQISNGDQVEIITSNVQKPSEEWLSYVVTAKAKSKIKDALKKEKKEVAEEGKEKVKRTFERHKVNFNSNNINELVQFYDQPSDLELYYKIATNKIKLAHLKNFNIQDGKLKRKKDRKTSQQKAIDSAIKNTLLQNVNLLMFGDEETSIEYDIASCCQPIPGDEIVAIIKEPKNPNPGSSKDLEVHKTHCPEAVELMSKYGDQIVKTKWTTNREVAFLTALKVTGIDDVGVMYRISKVISADMELNMQSITIEGDEGKFEGTIIVYIHDTTQLKRLVKKLKKVEGITGVEQLEQV
jgi:GTP pyrophosphokinase